MSTLRFHKAFKHQVCGYCGYATSSVPMLKCLMQSHNPQKCTALGIKHHFKFGVSFKISIFGVAVAPIFGCTHVPMSACIFVIFALVSEGNDHSRQSIDLVSGAARPLWTVSTSEGKNSQHSIWWISGSGLIRGEFDGDMTDMFL